MYNRTQTWIDAIVLRTGYPAELYKPGSITFTKTTSLKCPNKKPSIPAHSVDTSPPNGWANARTVTSGTVFTKKLKQSPQDMLRLILRLQTAAPPF